MRDDDSPDDSLPPSDAAERNEGHFQERAESIVDRIDRINRNAFQRIVCRRLVGRGEHAGH